eukprot:GAFH01001159.1.p1 GENE.GAFH01001159.1~~GAFH01001159.1.p1  ORF type:complete len:480 (+),score=194.88 GAFH01001159.1:337-1776(+)
MEAAIEQERPRYIRLERIPQIMDSLRQAFQSGITRPLEWRLGQLRQMKQMMDENMDKWNRALMADLHKSAPNAFLQEIGLILTDLKEAIASVKSWMSPTTVATPVAQVKGITTSRVHTEPLGLVLIISPWNYPLSLALQPLVGAIAAGNCAVLKPSELSPNCSSLLADLVPRYLDARCVAVAEGAVPETTALLEQRWDHIFFTGSTDVGRVVYQAAARYLTPVTLELGGKSPCIVAADADLKIAARRIASGKFMNVGQTCVAPDYVLVDPSIEAALVQALKEVIPQFYSPYPKNCSDYGRIISARHLQRLQALLAEDAHELTLLHGGVAVDLDDLYMEPTLVKCSPQFQGRLMREEIFGPILPIIALPNLVEESIKFINARPKPLSLYVYTNAHATAERITGACSSGGFCINECVLHLQNSALPFGGVGASGMGMYHGKYSYDCFSHHRAGLDKAKIFDVDLRYPPYTDAKMAKLRPLL